MTFADLVNKMLYKNDRHLLHEILFNQHLIIKNQEETMAKVVDLQGSVDALSAQVALIPQAGGSTPPTGIQEADLDPIKAGIDSATAAIAAKLTPAPAPVV